MTISREENAMQYVLDLLTDGILTSTKQQIGFTNPDKVPETDLPFVQAYAGVSENQDEVERQPGSVFTFNVDIIDFFDQRSKLAEVITDLDEEMRIDKSMFGTQQKGFMSLRTMAQRQVNERTVAGCIITVQLSDGFPDPSFTTVVSFANPVDANGDPSEVFPQDGTSEVESSAYVSGVTGVRKIATAARIQLATSNFLGSPGFPIDLSGANRLRVLSYINPEYSHHLTATELQLFSGVGLDWSLYRNTLIGAHGWTFPSYKLDFPAETQGAGAILSAVSQVNFIYRFDFGQHEFTSVNFGILVADCGYYARDTGDNNGRGYHPGF